MYSRPEWTAGYHAQRLRRRATVYAIVGTLFAVIAVLGFLGTGVSASTALTSGGAAYLIGTLTGAAIFAVLPAVVVAVMFTRRSKLLGQARYLEATEAPRSSSAR